MGRMRKSFVLWGIVRDEKNHFIIMLRGCIYPVYRTVQPVTKVMVLDKENRAVKEEKINLIIRKYYPF